MPLACRVTLLALPLALGAMALAGAEQRRNWFDTPFDQALAGAPDCPRPEGPRITEEEMRRQAHGRIERGTSCWLSGECADSNVYRRDPEVQQRALAAVRAEPVLARASVWLTTERRWVTVDGCLPTAAAHAALLARLRAVDGVERVIDRTVLGTRGPPRWPVDPAWSTGKKKPTQ
jgi:hypothetical protein